MVPVWGKMVEKRLYTVWGRTFEQMALPTYGLVKG